MEQITYTPLLQTEKYYLKPKQRHMPLSAGNGLPALMMADRKGGTMDYLSVKEVAELKGCSEQYIKKQCKNGVLSSILQEHPQNHKLCYRIPVAAMPEQLQARYYRQKRQEAGVLPEQLQAVQDKQEKQKKPIRQKSIEDCTAQERQLLQVWTGILQEWKAQRMQYRTKTEFDRLYVGKLQLEHPELQISIGILYRKWAAYQKGDVSGLLGERGAWNRGNSTIPNPVWEAFLWYWLDENKPTVRACYRNVISWTEEFYPELTDQIPSERSFRRHIDNDIAVAVKTLMRDGEKAFSDRCMPYIMRMYDRLRPNDVWIADNHTLDIQSLDDTNTIHRLYLTAFLDAKTGVIVGWNITDSPDSQSTILALRHGIRRFGIPKSVYFDNGREFLTHDIGGKGHRARKSGANVIEPPTILQRLGIEMHNAIVRNAKAKPIERTFYTVKNQFSKSFDGFCGGTILERPESLKRRIKNKAIPMDYEIRSYLDTWIDGEYNLQEYGGSEQKFTGKSRLDVWNQEIREVRKAAEEELNLMLMRSTRIQKIKRNGVYVTIAGEKLWYMNPEETILHLNEEVYVRYDPADLRTVRLYNTSDQYLYTWGLEDMLLVEYITSQKEEISDAQKMIRHSKKIVRDQAKGITAGLTNEQRITAIDMTVRRAQTAKEERFNIIMPKNIVPVRAQEAPLEEHRMVSGGEQCVSIDLQKIQRNATKRKEE